MSQVSTFHLECLIMQRHGETHSYATCLVVPVKNYFDLRSRAPDEAACQLLCIMCLQHGQDAARPLCHDCLLRNALTPLCHESCEPWQAPSSLSVPVIGITIANLSTPPIP